MQAYKDRGATTHLSYHPPCRTPRARGGVRWRLASSGWSTSRSTRPRTKVPNASALKAPKRAQPRYKIPPARQPAARPEFSQRTAGPLLTKCQSSGSRHGTGVQLTPLGELLHPPILLSQLKLSTTTPFGVFQFPSEFSPH
eukprot:scaffold3812_cov115-Isochrysis_galbana.AAC.4